MRKTPKNKAWVLDKLSKERPTGSIAFESGFWRGIERAASYIREMDDLSENETEHAVKLHVEEVKE